MKIMIKALWATGLLTLSAQIYADCVTSQNAWVLFPNRSSIDIDEGKMASQKFHSGLSCTGLAGVANTAYIRYVVNSVPQMLHNKSTGENLGLTIRDEKNNIVGNGTDVDLTTFDLFTIFNGPDNSLPFYATVNPGQVLSPGVYESQSAFRVRWYYSVPAFAAGGVGLYHESPRMRRIPFRWGDGVQATTHFRITIERDCRISVQDVNLGTAAFANQLEQVYTDVGVRCSSRTPYSVAINDGSHSNGGQRRLKSTSSNHYINYDIYKNFYDQRWGSTGEQPWISNHATQNSGIYDGRTTQIFKMRTKVTPNNPENLPGGQYKDNLRMEIRF